MSGSTPPRRICTGRERSRNSTALCIVLPLSRSGAKGTLREREAVDAVRLDPAASVTDRTRGLAELSNENRTGRALTGLGGWTH